MRQPAFVDHCLELFAPLGAVRVRRMFGGWGLYLDELFVALIAADRLYLKADATTRDRFAAAGCEPFVYDRGAALPHAAEDAVRPAVDATGHASAVVLGYWTAPVEAMDSPALMAPWARLALQAALAARAARSVKPPRRAASRAATRRPTSGPSRRRS